MHSFIALYLIACLDPTNHNTCVSLPVTDSSQAQPDGSEMSMMGCMGIEGANSAKKFWEDHPDMHKAYHFGGWSCQIGNKKAPDRGKLEADHDIRTRARPKRATTPQARSSLSVWCRQPRMARMAQWVLRRIGHVTQVIVR